MKSIAVLFVGAVAVPEQPSFEEWAQSYGINGANDAMKAKYDANVVEINRLNAEQPDATFAVNEFSGMSFDEFSAAYLGATDAGYEAFTNDTLLSPQPDLEVAVGGINWVGQGAVTPIKNQNACGSCWAFSTMAGVESIHLMHTGQTLNLAEQQLVDCSSGSCNGGNVGPSLGYLQNNPPCTTASYPYTAKDGTCRSCTTTSVRVSGYKQFTASESGLQTGLMSSPVSVTVMADSTFQHYASGVLSGSSTCTLNHAVLAVGFDGTAYKIKNSWGTSWGENGYIRIKQDVGGCGAYGIAYRGAIQPTLSAGSDVVV
jgi:cathepsin L